MNEDTGWAMIFAAALYAFAVFNAVKAISEWRRSRRVLSAGDVVPENRNDEDERPDIAGYIGWSVFCLLLALAITFTEVFQVFHID